MEPVSDLHIFCAVVEEGSLVKAGERLQLSSALISKRLQNLEARLGVRLLQRTTRRLSLTPEGELYYQRGRLVLDDLAETEALLMARQVEPSGMLKVTASASFGREHLMPHMPAFLERYPQMEVHLLLTDTVLDLIESGMDLAIRIGHADKPGWVARKLCANRRVLCAAPSYLAKYGEPQTPQDLAKHNCLLLAEIGARKQTWNLSGPKGSTAVEVSGNLVSNLGEALGEAALAGGGIAIRSTWSGGAALRSGQLKRILPDYELPVVDVVALYPSRRHLSPKVRVLIDFLLERFGDPPYWDRGLD